VINNNLMKRNSYGINGNSVGEGLVAFSAYAPDVTMLRNAMADGSASKYPTGNFFPTLAQWTADFVNIAATDYRLLSSSLSQNAGTDGKDLGVDFAELNAAMNSSAPPPTPPPSTGNTPFSGTPIALPGTIQAENYDKGGEGVGYHDTTSGNSGGAYRSDNVDIKATTDAGGGYNLKSVRGGEWLLYTIKVATAGTYAIDLRVASAGSGGTVHLSLDGTNLTGAWSLPDTGSWTTWKTVTKTGIALPAGQHTLKLSIDANGSGGTAADINWIQFRDTSINTTENDAYGGTPVSLPGTIQAEKYDTGGRDVSYHDTTAGNAGGAFRNDDVDINPTTDSGGGYHLKSVRGGEWLLYTVDVATAGTYAIDLRIASSGPGGTVHLSLDGTNLTGAWSLPDTGSWATWTTVTKTGIALPAGQHTLKLSIDTNGSGGTAADINWIAVR
jgi:hypothetical protein